MKIVFPGKRPRQEGSILAYFIIMLFLAVAIASVAAYVAQGTNISHRRSNMVAANQYALGAAVVACDDLNKALTGTNVASLGAGLQSLPTPYSKNNSLSTPATNVFERTLSANAPFSNQTSFAQIYLPNTASPSSAMIVASTTVQGVTQTATVIVRLGWGYPAAIISVNTGTTETGVSKSVAKDGNIVINGDKSGPIVVSGNPGLAAWANGRVDYDTNYVNPPSSAYSMTNWNTGNQIPDFTTQGTSNALFDISRYLAVADKTPGGYSPAGNNHFTNLATFMTAVLAHTPTNPMQGVIAIDIALKDPDMGNLTEANLPNGINIKGTMLFNFIGTGWDPVSEKIIVTAAININAADLSHLVPTDPSTYTTGYPPVYTDATKNPININIAPYQNFNAGDDLPAEIYTIGCLDMHGNANICGVLYTPSYMEIENKMDSHTQYIRGACIMGNGIYFENLKKSTSIISLDMNSLDALATLNNTGKKVRVAYWK